VSADRATVEGLMRALAPQALDGRAPVRAVRPERGRRAGSAARWPTEGVPDNLHGWLTTVAGRRVVDQIRSEQARRLREDAVAAREPGSDVARSRRGHPGQPG
jgi:hypothetical protein